nr:hypothetical protein [Burkholderia ubonensis]
MAEPVRPIARHPAFHDGELDAHRRFGVVDEAGRMRDVVPTRPSIGVRYFIETQPFMFVGAGCATGGRRRRGCTSQVRVGRHRGQPELRVRARRR